MIDHNTASDSRFCEKNEQKYAVRLPLFGFCFLFSDLVFRRKRFGRFRKRSAITVELNYVQLRPAAPIYIPRYVEPVGAWSTAE